MINSKTCPCPYIPCKLRGNCEKCIEKSRRDHELCNCMERIAIKEYGLKLEPKQISNIIVEDTEEEVARKSADMIMETIHQKSDSLICLPAGSTAIKTYEYLVKQWNKRQIDTSKVRFIALDEWVDVKQVEENCESFLKKHFFNHINIEKERVRFFNTKGNLKEECRAVDEYIFKNGKIDFMLLGIGMNGHLGLNEPFDEWDQYAHVVDLDETTKVVGQKYFSKNTQLTRGITLGIKHIFETKTVVLQVTGSKKALIIKKLFESHIDFDLPASALKLMRDSYLIMDQEAAQLINLDED